MEKVKVSFIIKLVFIGIILSGITAVAVMKFLFSMGTINLPDFTGTELEKAVKTGSRLGVEIKVENEVDSNLYEKGRIISQDMPAKSKIKKGRAIYVVVSRGSRMVKVPNVRGMLMSKAVIELKNSFLDTGYETTVSSFTFPKDTVIAQVPDQGAEIPSGTQVNILKSSGPPDFDFMMPDFTSMNISEIYSLIRKYELAISSLAVEESEKRETGAVISQHPQPGSRINKDTPVSFTVSRMPGDTSLKQRLIKCSYKYDDAAAPALVKIQVLSLNGSETVYNEITQPGRLISVSATVRGDALVQVFLAAKIAKEIEFKAEAAQ